MNKIVSLLNKKLQNSYQKGRARARTCDLYFIRVTPYQLRYNRILDDEDVRVVRSNKYQCRLTLDQHSNLILKTIEVLTLRP